MKEIQLLSLLCIAEAAVLSDVWKGKIPNAITATGIVCALAYQLAENGCAGVLLWMGGAALPALLFCGFYYFRMIGAGDVKLLCVLGGFLGPSDCLECIAVSVLSGGILSLLIMLRCRSLSRRLAYFAEYISTYSRELKWRPYLEQTPQEARFCFSVPVLLGTIYYIAGGLI